LSIGQLKQRSDMSRLHETSWHFLLENLIVEGPPRPWPKVAFSGKNPCGAAYAVGRAVWSHRRIWPCWRDKAVERQELSGFPI
jgi:hypothetical protein